MVSDRPRATSSSWFRRLMKYSQPVPLPLLRILSIAWSTIHAARHQTVRAPTLKSGVLMPCPPGEVHRVAPKPTSAIVFRSSGGKPVRP